jgi:hypothetical protein
VFPSFIASRRARLTRSTNMYHLQELFLCYRPCFSPTAVTACVSARLDGAARPASLVVARGSQLEIYATASCRDAVGRLRLRASVALSASLVGLHVVTVAGRRQLHREAPAALAYLEAVDLLLLCLAPAKLVLAKFDPRLGRLVPVRCEKGHPHASGTPLPFCVWRRFCDPFCESLPGNPCHCLYL